MENNIDLSLSELKERKQKSFAENRYTENSLGKFSDLQDLELDQTDKENKFYNRTNLSQTKIEQNRFRKHKEPDIYNGESVEWPDYLCHFEQVSMWNAWNDSEKATQLAMSLRGQAQRVLSELTHRELNNYSDLKNALSQRFSPAERETSYRCDFRNRRRRVGESAADYGYVLRRLASRAFPTFPPEMRESLIVEQYVTGLGSQELKRYVQFSHPTTLDRAISLALEFESFEGTQDSIKKHRDTEKSSIRAIVTPKANDSDNHVDINNLEKSIEQIVRKTLSTFMEKKHESVDDNKTTHSTTSRNIKCFNCKQHGHISRNCPLKQQREPENRQRAETKNDSSHLNANGLRSRP
jgi:hypothetical protein